MRKRIDPVGKDSESYLYIDATSSVCCVTETMKGSNSNRRDQVIKPSLVKSTQGSSSLCLLKSSHFLRKKSSFKVSVLRIHNICI